MKKEKKAKELKPKGKHSSGSNIVWALKNLWNMDKYFCLFAIPGIPISVILSLAGSYLPKVIIDMLGKKRSFMNISITLTLFIAGILILTLIMRYAEAQCWGRRYTISNRYQNMAYEKGAVTDYEHLEQQEYKKISGFAWDDLCHGNAAVEFVWSDLQNFAIQFLGIITLASLMTVLNPIVFAVILTVSILTYFLTRWQPAYEESNKEKWEKESRKCTYLEGISEDFTKAKDIKLYGMQSWINQMLHDYQSFILMWQNRCCIRGMWASILSAMLTLIQDGTAYLFLIGMLFAGKLSVGNFVFYFGIVGTIADYFTGIINSVSGLVRRGEKIGYVRDFLEMQENFNHGKGCELPNESHLPVKIELKEVWYQYEGAKDYTLKGINLTIEPGERIALVGINGAGKTTLVKLLCGFYTPTKGQILVGGRLISEYNIDEYFSLISAVFQDIDVPAMTICEFVGITDYEKTIDRKKAEKALRAAGFGEQIDSLKNGMDTYLKKGIYPDAIDLSGGETQKLMLARAIYKDGSLLILDEPTAALDPIAENKLYLEYNRLTQNKTSIYISHRFASTRFCDRIALLEDGRIKELGSHDELMQKNGQYAYMFGVQSKYYKEGSIDE